ncbi:hypothetical protein GCM10022254_32470 [Actinomadura meridiana]|uniref:Uncharacterized protein n=1 Tax=Actinomadura meridiana TaxID=559626 RepID=A0ABP8C2C7_9ACTN
MIEDPLTTWPGGFPYRVLADAGITPRSTRADVEAAAFTLMAEGMMNPTTQQAWSRLRDVPSRLLMDLLLYDIDDATIGRLHEEITRELAESAQEAGAPGTLPAGSPRPAAVPDDLFPFPSPSFLDGLIRFDR